MNIKTLVAALACAGFATAVHATNGMNLEGYGPIATGMGGASFAYDNGNAAMMNNPATLGLVADGSNRLDVALGMLGPDVTSRRAPMPNAGSGGDAYFMPAAGWSRRTGALTYGVGMFGQGGMGTEYGSASFMSGYRSMLGAQGMSGQEARSELGVGRVILPLVYNVKDTLTIGGSLDFVWGGLDLKMPMGGAMFADMMPGSTNVFGEIAPTSTMLIPMGGMLNPGCNATTQPCMTDVNWAHFDFSDGNDFTQKARGRGWAGKIGAAWKVAPNVTVGAVYHAKTAMSDFKGSATMRMNVDMVVPNGMGGSVAMPGTSIPVSGRIRIHDFQWPETYGVGLAVQATDRLRVAADYKRINWSDVMRNFKMTFAADATQANPMAAGFGGLNMTATLYQNWDDQDVFMIGAAYKATDALTLRAGVNLAGNPIPNANVNPLFPATIKNHYTVGLGYAFNRASDLNFSLSYAPEVSVANPNMGVSIGHSQLNWQLMYSHRF